MSRKRSTRSVAEPRAKPRLDLPQRQLDMLDRTAIAFQQLAHEVADFTPGGVFRPGQGQDLEGLRLVHAVHRKQPVEGAEAAGPGVSPGWHGTSFKRSSAPLRAFRP